MLTKQDGYKMAVDMLLEICGDGDSARFGSNYNLVENPPDDAGDDWEHKINEAQDNIVFRHIQALSADPANVEALKGFCAVLTDKIAIGADAVVYEELTA